MWTKPQKRVFAVFELVVGLSMLGVTLLRKGRDPVLMVAMSVVFIALGAVTLARNRQPE